MSDLKSLSTEWPKSCSHWNTADFARDINNEVTGVFSPYVTVVYSLRYPQLPVKKKTKSACGTPYTDAIHVHFVTISETKCTFHAIN
jgi:hypothetical protein